LLRPKFIADSSRSDTITFRKFKLLEARRGSKVVGFEIYRDEGGEYRWRFRADNGEIVASGEGYRRKEDCAHAVRLIKDQAPQAEMADRT
jgi:uncharacterized protein YegP (UPF0339 family)